VWFYLAPLRGRLRSRFRRRCRSALVRIFVVRRCLRDRGGMTTTHWTTSMNLVHGDLVAPLTVHSQSPRRRSRPYRATANQAVVPRIAICNTGREQAVARRCAIGRYDGQQGRRESICWGISLTPGSYKGHPYGCGLQVASVGQGLGLVVSMTAPSHVGSGYPVKLATRKNVKLVRRLWRI
jgi:hypothetical protein